MWWLNNPSLRSKPKLIDAIELWGSRRRLSDPHTGDRSQRRQARRSRERSNHRRQAKGTLRRSIAAPAKRGSLVSGGRGAIQASEGCAGPDLPGDGGCGGRGRPRTYGLRVGDRPTRLRFRVARHVGRCWAAVGYSCRVFTAFDRQPFVGRRPVLLSFEEFPKARVATLWPTLTPKVRSCFAGDLGATRDRKAYAAD